ncbi:hypothetical protein NDU88_012894 [Pleurodeles waltl]|uniref:Uncharacterized protein n=1 Tax=Pleurodeles waltl TaxID=8319 RepID=A0AAV7R7E5_PLEWA|nr:hypothetical protein NDU88_012894 [Pleurodeles waltl]
MQAHSGNLENYALPLFRHVALALIDKDITLDHTHRAGCPVRTPGTSQDILTCFHFYKQKELTMEAVRDKTAITFEGTKVDIFQDLAAITLQRRMARRPATTFLWKKGVRYCCDHPSRLISIWNKERHRMRTIEEAQAVLGLPSYWRMTLTIAGQMRCITHQRNHAAAREPEQSMWPNPPSPKVKRETAALLKQLQQHGNIYDPEND